MAKKQKPEVRILYVKRGDYEAYRIETRQDEHDSWGLTKEFQFCSAVEYPNPDGDKQYLHFTILKELLWCMELGYNVHWRIVDDKDNR